MTGPRTVFIVYCVLIATGIALSIAIGATHQ